MQNLSASFSAINFILFLLADNAPRRFHHDRLTLSGEQRCFLVLFLVLFLD